MRPIGGRARGTDAGTEATFSSCEHCQAQMPAKAPVDVNAELVAGTEAVSDSMRVFSRANLFEDLSVASTTAAEASEALDARLAVVAEAEDEELRAAATEVLEAQQATLTSFANTFSNYRTQDFGRWDAREQTMQARLNRLSQAQDELVALENDDITARIDVAAAEEVLTDLGRLVRDKQKRVPGVAGGGAPTAGSGIPGGGLVRPPGLRRSRLRAIMAEYSALRTELAQWTQEIDRRFVSIAEGYLVLAQAASDRREIRNRFAALQVPAVMASAHSSLLSVVDEGIAGVDSAVEGLNVYVNDPYYRYWDARDTPGWITFSSASDRVTGQFETARATWDAALAAEQNRIQNSPVPPRPEL